MVVVAATEFLVLHRHNHPDTCILDQAKRPSGEQLRTPAEKLTCGEESCRDGFVRISFAIWSVAVDNGSYCLQDCDSKRMASGSDGR